MKPPFSKRSLHYGNLAYICPWEGFIFRFENPKFPVPKWQNFCGRLHRFAMESNIADINSFKIWAISSAVKCLNFTAFLHLRSQDGDIKRKPIGVRLLQPDFFAAGSARWDGCAWNLWSSYRPAALRGQQDRRHHIQGRLHRCRVLADFNREGVSHGHYFGGDYKGANFDELDHLAKRLDSFDAGEAAQFQAMAEKLDLCNITDFINLTFCCQQGWGHFPKKACQASRFRLRIVTLSWRSRKTPP